MEVIVVGASGTFPGAGGACNGYLVRSGRTNILLDMGAGVLSRLYGELDPSDLDALVITHLHPDHFTDVYPFRYYLEFAVPHKMPLKVLAPKGAADHIQQLFNEPNPARFGAVFDFKDLGQTQKVSIGEVLITGHEVTHLKPTFGITAESGGRRLFYTSDTVYDNRLVEIATGADLLLAETTLLADQADSPVAHMTTHQTGELAAKAGVSRLVLTHVLPHLDKERVMSEVRSRFDGKIDLADEGLVVEV